MAGWSGWTTDILQAVGAPDAQPLREFLSDWLAHEGAGCRNNPLLASQPASGATSCRKLPNGKVAKNYASPAQGTAATKQQLESGDYPHLLRGLRQGLVWQPGFAPDIYSDLQAWGAAGFAKWYRDFFGANWGSGEPAPGGISAPRAHGGWADLRRSVNHRMPKALHASQRTSEAALRRLQRARKVRL